MGVGRIVLLHKWWGNGKTGWVILMNDSLSRILYDEYYTHQLRINICENLSSMFANNINQL